MSQRIRLVVLVIAVGAGLLFALWPRIVHGLDHGQETVPAGKLAGGYRPQSRNLVVEGMLDAEHVVDRMVTDENGHTKERRDYLPLVPMGWTPKEPVHLLYSVHAWADFLKPYLQAPTHPGILRDVMFEGSIPPGVVSEFQKMGVTVAEDARIVEATELAQ